MSVSDNGPDALESLRGKPRELFDEVPETAKDRDARNGAAVVASRDRPRRVFVDPDPARADAVRKFVEDKTRELGVDAHAEERAVLAEAKAEWGNVETKAPGLSESKARESWGI